MPCPIPERCVRQGPLFRLRLHERPFQTGGTWLPTAPWQRRLAPIRTCLPAIIRGFAGAAVDTRAKAVILSTGASLAYTATRMV